MIALQSDRRWVHGLQSKRSSLLQGSLQRDGGWIWEKGHIILGGFSEGLQAERRKRFRNREEEQLRAEQRESNHCQKQFRSPEVRCPSSMKLQSLLPCSQDTPERSSYAPTELLPCLGPAQACQSLTPRQGLNPATRLGQPGGWSRGSAPQGWLFPAPLDQTSTHAGGVFKTLCIDKELLKEKN